MFLDKSLSRRERVPRSGGGGVKRRVFAPLPGPFGPPSPFGRGICRTFWILIHRPVRAFGAAYASFELLSKLLELFLQVFDIPFKLANAVRLRLAFLILFAWSYGAGQQMRIADFL